MLFIVIRRDKPDSFALRRDARPAHLAYLERVLPRIMGGGALLDEEGRQDGSMLIIEATDEADAEAFADSDPFVQAGLFASTSIRKYRPVFSDGAWLEYPS